MSFRIIRNDITKTPADAVVNTANPRPVFSSGTDSAVYYAAGAAALLAERRKIGDIAVGDAAYTPAFALPAKYIIHTVGPVWRGGSHGERQAVRSCYEKSLVLAKELGCESIAFPLLATGTYGFPKADALQIAVSVFSEFLAENDMEIILTVFDAESFVLSGKIFAGVDAYIDEKYVLKQFGEEYPAFPPERAERGNRRAWSLRRRREEREDYSALYMPEDSDADIDFPSEPLPPMPSAAEPCASAAWVDAEESLDEDIITGIADAFKTEDIWTDSAAEEEEDEFGTTQQLPDIFKKTTAKAPRSLAEIMGRIGATWQESLFTLIDEKGYTDTEVYKRANIDRKLFSKIRSNAHYQPKKITAVALALALHLNLDETRDFLARAGYALSPSSRFDLIVQYFIENGVYDTYTINLALFDHDQPLLGA